MSFPTTVNHEITVPVAQTGYVKVIVQYVSGDVISDITQALDDAHSRATEYVSAHSQPPIQG